MVKYFFKILTATIIGIAALGMVIFSLLVLAKPDRVLATNHFIQINKIMAGAIWTDSSRPRSKNEAAPFFR